MKKSDEVLAVLLVIIGCIMIGIAARSLLVGAGLWSCVTGMMICVKYWIEKDTNAIR